MAEWQQQYPKRLYLAKTDRINLYVDETLPQHQIDGIRFLYRQFKKRKPGVVLNDPSGYGKRVQTALFINAIRPLLDAPVLILCNEGKEQQWFQRFNKWTCMGTEVAVELCNPAIQKAMVYINPMCHVSTFARREWALVVVDDHNVARDVLRSGLTSRFRIWLTSVDMKKNLQTFSLIYKWIYPKERFIVEDFQAIKKEPSVVYIKSIKLDAFMEDIVIRRKDVPLPLGKWNKSVHALPRVTRKNKDATGTKIKRTKRKPDDAQPTTTEPKDIQMKMAKNGENESKHKLIEDITVKIGNMPIKIEETFDKNPLTHDDIMKNEIEKETFNKSDFIIQVISQNEMDKSTKDQSKPNEMIVDNYDVKTDSPMECDSKDSPNIFNNDSILSQNIIIRYGSETPDIEDEIMVDISDTKNTNEKLNGNKNGEIESKNPFSTDLISHVNEINDESDVKGHDINRNATNLKYNERVNKNNEVDVGNTFSILPSNEVKSESIEVKDDIHSNTNELDSKNNVSENNKTDPKCDSKLEGVELKIKHLEELTRKKFKGSLLDSLF